MRYIEYRTVKFIESESTLVDARVQGVVGGEMRSKCLMGTEIQFRKVKNSGNG